MSQVEYSLCLIKYWISYWIMSNKSTKASKNTYSKRIRNRKFYRLAKIILCIWRVGNIIFSWEFKHTKHSTLDMHFCSISCLNVPWVFKGFFAYYFVSCFYYNLITDRYYFRCVVSTFGFKVTVICLLLNSVTDGHKTFACSLYDGKKLVDFLLLVVVLHYFSRVVFCH